ncbi:MAG: PAS domain-containing protein [Verrucomicrobia bacterium]|nr:PAS domain-containing protein [Verrucomicrobiota bacterium]
MTAEPTSLFGNQPNNLSSLCLALSERAPFPIAAFEGPSHILCYANPAFCKSIGKPFEQLAGKPFHELLPDEDGCVGLLNRVFRTEKVESHTGQEQPSNGHPVFKSYTARPVFTDERLVGVTIQVMELAKVNGKTVTMNTEAANELASPSRVEIYERERALRETENRYHYLFNSINEGFCVIELIFDEHENPIDYRFLEINPSFEKQCGLQNAVGKRMRELAPNHEDYWFEMYGKVALTGESVRYVNESNAWGNRWFDAHAFRLGGPESRKVGVLFTDITTQKNSDIALEKAQDQLSRYAADLEGKVMERTALLRDSIGALETLTYTMAHDLRSPLRAMKGFTTALLEDVPLDDVGQSYASRIHLAADRMDQLIDNLMDYGQLTHMQFHLHPVDLKVQIGEVLAQLCKEIQSANADIRVTEPIPSISGNEILMEQILSNLLLNALKFVGPGVVPNILIHAETRGSLVRLWVEDNGIGIPSHYQENIFGMFKRLHTPEEYPGTGVGLAIVRRAAERMRGTAGVESEAGHGSKFWVDLLLAPPVVE